MMASATSFCRSPAVLVHDEWRSTMASDWTDAVVVSCSKRLGFAVFARKHGDASEAPNSRRWQTLDAVTNIRVPGVLFAALEGCEDTLDISLDWGRVVSEISRLDPDMGSALSAACQLEGQRVSAADVERSLAGEPAWTSEQRLLLNALHENCREEEPWRYSKARRSGPLSGYPWLALEERLFGNSTKQLERSRAHGLGCSASYLDGIGIDVIGYAGLKYSDELHDALWGERNWQKVVSDCPSSDYFQVGEQDDAPGMSDVFFWVSVGDPREFARELRVLLVESLAQCRERGVGA